MLCSHAKKDGHAKQWQERKTQPCKVKETDQKSSEERQEEAHKRRSQRVEHNVLGMREMKSQSRVFRETGGQIYFYPHVSCLDRSVISWAIFVGKDPIRCSEEVPASTASNSQACVEDAGRSISRMVDRFPGWSRPSILLVLGQCAVIEVIPSPV